MLDLCSNRCDGVIFSYFHLILQMKSAYLQFACMFMLFEISGKPQSRFFYFALVVVHAKMMWDCWLLLCSFCSAEENCKPVFEMHGNCTMARTGVIIFFAKNSISWLAWSKIVSSKKAYFSFFQSGPLCYLSTPCKFTTNSFTEMIYSLDQKWLKYCW